MSMTSGKLTVSVCSIRYLNLIIINNAIAEVHVPSVRKIAVRPNVACGSGVRTEYMNTHTSAINSPLGTT